MNTKDKIKSALLRIEKGRTKIVANDRKLSIAAVAAEAGIHPSTIINRHSDLADIIRKKSGITKKIGRSDNQQVKLLKDQLASARNEIATLKKALAVAISKQASDVLREKNNEKSHAIKNIISPKESI
jgi:hypothetical protein